MVKAKTIDLVKTLLVLAFSLVLEIVIFYWLGIGATDFDKATWAFYFTQIFLAYAALFRIVIYLKIWMWDTRNRTLFRLKSYVLFLLPVATNFCYQMLSVAPTFQNWPVKANYFIAYLIVETLLAIGFITFVEKFPLPDAKPVSKEE